MGNENWIAGAVEALAGGATTSPKPTASVPCQIIPRAKKAKKPSRTLRGEPHSGGHSQSATQRATAPGTQIEAASDMSKPTLTPPPRPHSSAPWQTRNPLVERAEEPELAGHRKSDAQSTSASQTPSVDGHVLGADQQKRAVDGTLMLRVREEWRRRQDMIRARLRLELQAQAVCRRAMDGDKVKGAKMWAEVKADPDHMMRVWLRPFIMAMTPLDAAQKDIEKSLTKLARGLPAYDWAKSVRGLSEVQFAGVVSECGEAVGPGDFKSVSALWKRMGMAVIDGGRQRKVSGGDAVLHGYVAERRSHLWNIGGTLMKAQLRSMKGEDGKKIDGSEYAIGDLGQVYLDRKAYMRAQNEAGDYAERAAKIVADAKKRGSAPLAENEAGQLTPIHIHNDAKRYMEKRLLRELWKAWRRANAVKEPNEMLPAAEIQVAA